ncbi:MAG: D-glycero-beta-D-manno-heptose 1-phosphate adenylyltransferase [Deltaproteobacteria bacterium]|jgi:rfaE bifunctional protein nucleotidyltransferase chain/domain|nr:D-glycero-beta-D-manno-heptose 1-phosphate adenylyltransferase [Deltaproteobacteria bacterium]
MDNKLLTLEEALHQRENLRELGRTLVFTNGCFDLLHPGHLSYLAEAKHLGNALFVGLNSDSSARGLKGPKRPVNNEKDRALMLSGLYMVDAVVIFSEDTPVKLIEALKPDILVKGGDWAVKDIAGGEFTLSRGGKVLSLPFLPGYSSTALINKIAEAYGKVP